MPTYTILYGHSGAQGQQWDTAREASQYAAETWGEVEASSAAEAVETARAEGLDVGDWYEEMERDVVHVIPSASAEKA